MTKIQEIKKAIKNQFGMKIKYWNDLNKDKSIRRIKIDLITETDFFKRENVDQEKMMMYADFIRNNFKIDNVKVVKTTGHFDGWNIVFKIENK
jgi:nanoRNase/pAp phosphatase (c-di-AMP/oligoRNAs hydrolase)